MGSSPGATRYVAVIDNVHKMIRNRKPRIKKNFTKTGAIKVEEISYNNYCEGLITQAVYTYLEKEENTLEPLCAKYFNNKEA